MTSEVLAVFAGYDDDALVALANAGLLRRARKDVAAGEVSLTSESAAEVVVACGTSVVRLGPRGPVAASCSCPTAGVCQHVVAACLWAREQATARGPEVAPGGAGGARDTAPAGVPDPLRELLGLDPAAVCRAAGRPAVRRVVERLPAGLLGALAGPGSDDAGSGAAAGACDVVTDGARLTITWTDHARTPTQVVFVAPAGFAGMIVAGTRSAPDQAAARLEAVVRAFAHEGRQWSWPHEIETERSGELTDAQLAGAAEASTAVGHVVDAGLSHLGADAADALRGAASRARLVGLQLLHRLLLTSAGLVEALAARDDDVTEADTLGALAEAWALTAALRDAPPETLPGLLGAPARRGADDGTTSGDDERPGRLVPLGVRWWSTPSGARGMTLTAWDTLHGTLRTATAARASGADPTFRRDVNLPLLWQTSVATACATPFELVGAETRPDGTLGTTDRTSLVPAGSFDVRELRQIADHLADPTTAATGTVGFGRVRRRVRLVMVRETGAVGVDEVRRDVTWPVTGADGRTQLLRIGVEHERAVEGLMSVVASRKTVVAVLVERDQDSGADEPVGIFVRDGQGSVTLFSPSMSPVHQAIASWTALRRLTARIAALRRDATVQVAEPVVRGPVARVCEPVLGVVDSLGATGRRRLTEQQRRTLVERRGLAEDLGMATVGRTIDALTADVTTATVLRARFVLGRAMALADG